MSLKRLSKEESIHWLQARGIEPLRNLRYYKFQGSEHVVYYSQPELNGKIAALSKHLAKISENEDELLLMVNEWGVFPTFESPVLVARNLQGYGDDTPLIKKRGFLFQPVDTQELADFIRLIMISCWDAVIAGKNSGLALEFSHDGWASFAFENSAQMTEFMKQEFLQRMNLDLHMILK